MLLSHLITLCFTILSICCFKWDSFPLGCSWYITVNNAPQKTLCPISAKNSTSNLISSKGGATIFSLCTYLYIFEEEILNATQYANSPHDRNVFFFFFCSFPKRTFLSRISEDMGYTWRTNLFSFLLITEGGESSIRFPTFQ